jgi:uncharacterized alkaline shock family protein YloU
MSTDPLSGKSLVTRRAIVDIVTTAVQSSYGVTALADPNVGRRILRWAGLDRPGIRMSTKDGLRLEVFLTVAFGVPVAEVARQVDSAVRYSIRRATGVEVASLTIHVNGMRHEPAAVQRAEEIERTSPAVAEKSAARAERAVREEKAGEEKPTREPMATKRARRTPAAGDGSTPEKAAGAPARRRTRAS